MIYYNRLCIFRVCLVAKLTIDLELIRAESLNFLRNSYVREHFHAGKNNICGQNKGKWGTLRKVVGTMKNSTKYRSIMRHVRVFVYGNIYTYEKKKQSRPYLKPLQNDYFIIFFHGGTPQFNKRRRRLYRLKVCKIELHIFHSWKEHFTRQYVSSHISRTFPQDTSVPS